MNNIRIFMLLCCTMLLVVCWVNTSSVIMVMVTVLFPCSPFIMYAAITWKSSEEIKNVANESTQRVFREAEEFDLRENSKESELREMKWQTFLKKTMEHYANEHLETLIKKHAQMVITDDYGIEDKSKWFKEMNYFVDKVVMPDVKAYLKEEVDSDNDLPRFAEKDIVEYLVKLFDINIDAWLEQQKKEDEISAN